MAKQKKPKGKHNIINRKTKDMKELPKDAPFDSVNRDHRGQAKNFNPLRPLHQPSPHTDGPNAGKPSAAGKTMDDAKRKRLGIGTPMGPFESKRLNPYNDKDAKEIKKGIEWMATHKTTVDKKTGKVIPNAWQCYGSRVEDVAQYNENFNNIDWGDGEIEGGEESSKPHVKFKKKY